MEMKLTTILMKLEGEWVLDTYPRSGNSNDKKFVERFMEEYSGNGIDDLRVLETKEFHFDYIYELEMFINNVKDNNKINTTILNY